MLAARLQKACEPTFQVVRHTQINLAASNNTQHHFTSLTYEPSLNGLAPDLQGPRLAYSPPVTAGNPPRPPPAFHQPRQHTSLPLISPPPFQRAKGLNLQVWTPPAVAHAEGPLHTPAEGVVSRKTPKVSFIHMDMNFTLPELSTLYSSIPNFHARC